MIMNENERRERLDNLKLAKILQKKICWKNISKKKKNFFLKKVCQNVIYG